MANYQVFYRKKFAPGWDIPSRVNYNEYEEVARVEALDLEELIRKMNELSNKLKYRSMSIGDVVVDLSTQDVFYFSPIGWAKTDWAEK